MFPYSFSIRHLYNLACVVSKRKCMALIRKGMTQNYLKLLEVLCIIIIIIVVSFIIKSEFRMNLNLAIFVHNNLCHRCPGEQSPYPLNPAFKNQFLHTRL